ncbi:MAG: co-chaperone DjlA [Legionellaceae bacterium]
MNLRPEHFTPNSWWGKLVGAFLGFLMAGPIGALLGIFIGNFFDRGLTQHFSRPYWEYQHERSPAVRADFLEATYTLLGYLAKSDGRVSEAEIEAIKTLMFEMQLNKKERELAKSFFNEGKKPSFQIKDSLEKISTLSRQHPHLKKLFIDIQYKIALIDGLSSSKISAFNVILAHLNIAPLYDTSEFHRSRANYSSYQEQQTTYSGALASAYAMLRVSPETNQADVKRAYRRLINKNHPDKMIARGLSDKAIKMANEKTQEIRKAYEKICESKGW